MGAGINIQIVKKIVDSGWEVSVDLGDGRSIVGSGPATSRTLAHRRARSFLGWALREHAVIDNKKPDTEDSAAV